MLPEVAVHSPTEDRNPATAEIDTKDSLAVLQLLNQQDRQVAEAVGTVLPQLAGLVDVAVQRISAGGRVHYFGAGTSGRLAVLDAAELQPTFNAPADWFVAHHAGGAAALIQAAENVEDDERSGAADAAGTGAGDVAIGLTASGRTPYVAGALRAAAEHGAVTALVTSHPDPDITGVDVLLSVPTGPEAITGSTRLKAGTAQKLVLNGFSTAVMVGLGRTYSNLMVDMRATNAKLRGRTVRILREATGADEQAARAHIEAADGELKTALVSILGTVSAADARAALAAADGVVRRALAALAGLRTTPAGVAVAPAAAPSATGSDSQRPPSATVPQSAPRSQGELP